MADLVLGPLLRHVATTTATVFVETDTAAQVTVRAGGASGRARTFAAHGHHYALVVVEGLPSGVRTCYQVEVDGVCCWPPPDLGWPAPSVPTLPAEGLPPAGRRPLQVAFGSCRVSVPDVPPWTEPAPRGFGHDALHALAVRMHDQCDSAWPDLLLCLGDQIYADEVTPWLASRLPLREPGDPVPSDEVVGFADYCALYEAAWSPTALRWLLSTVPSAMIFDDHDVEDDWNTSAAWREQMAHRPWWGEKITSAFASYWIYQHLGNLSPQALADDELWQQVQAADGDVGPLLDEMARRADADPTAVRWSFDRALGDATLVVVDSRAARVLEPEDGRQMVAPQEWQWVRRAAARGTDRPGPLLLASSLPFLLPEAMHWVEAANSALCRGSRGRRAAAWGEKLRQAADLEHWAAFDDSFDDWQRWMAELAADPNGPTGVITLSGDVHHGYLARADLPGPPVWQVTVSPVRQQLPRVMQAAVRAACRRSVGALARGIAGALGASSRRWCWRVTDGPYFDNLLGVLWLGEGGVSLELMQAVPGDTADRPRLRSLCRRRLTTVRP